MQKKTLAIIFGGRSAEHEVSVNSARNVVAALNRDLYEVVLIGVSQSGAWHLVSNQYLKDNDRVGDEQPPVAILPGSQGQLVGNESASLPKIDLAFPVLHGPFGEDGATQGVLKLAGIPFVGAGVLGSAVGMDKEIMKRLLHEAGLPIAKFITVQAGDKVGYQTVADQLGCTFFIKPANLGSSVGINKVHSADDFEQHLAEAFRYDRKVVIEENVPGRELECAVLGNAQATATVPGEVIPHEEFYSYSAKYLNEDGAALELPAKLDSATVQKIKDLALATFHALDCAGLARVDFFLREDGQPIINEINTIPGFTSISMYPKLWLNEGLSYTELIDRLLELAVERFEQEAAFKTTFGD